MRREPTVQDYLPLAKAEAYRFAQDRRDQGKALGGRDELLSAAYRGLLTARRRWTRSRGTWASYVTRCIRWELLEHTEDIARGKRLLTVPWNSEADARPDPGPGPEGCCLEVVAQSDLGHVLRAIVSQLPEREGLVIGLLYWEGLTWDEAARLLHCSTSRVGQLQRSALRHLRDLLVETSE